MGVRQSRRPSVTTKTAYRGALVNTLTGHSNAVLGCCFSPDGKLFATCAADHSIVLWDAKNFKRKHTLVEHTDTVTAICFSPETSLLVSGLWHK